MPLTSEHVQQMAPDEASATAGRKLQAIKLWQNLGKNSEALWGECLGSATYQVKVDLGSLAYKCSCPSRKFPCKHVLGLLFMVSAGQAIPLAQPPEWVSDWLSKRQETQAKKEAKTNEQAGKPVDEKAQQKRAEQRLERVSLGIEQLDIWLKDLVRRGLAGLETQDAGFWNEQARRLVDAQAPGLAARLRRLGEIPGSSSEWPKLLVSELGKLKLAIQAFRRMEQLDPDLGSELRQWIGWSVSQEELAKVGEKVTDDWLTLGQWVEEEDHFRVQRTWLQGQASKRLALMLQFAAGSAPFLMQLIPGTVQHGTMTYYPGVSRQRAYFGVREESIKPMTTTFSGHATMEGFLGQVAQELARQPWLNAFGCLLHQVSLCRNDHRWFVRDQSGQTLPLATFDAWRLLAQSGGHPFDLAGEWDGIALRALGVFLEGAYRLV